MGVLGCSSANNKYSWHHAVCYLFTHVSTEWNDHSLMPWKKVYTSTL